MTSPGNEKDFLQPLVDIAKEFLVMVNTELDPYTSKKGEIQEDPAGVTLLTPFHTQFAKYGRAPGRKPPLDAMLEYVKKRNIKFDGISERGTAFAIQASIGKYGSKNWVPNAPNAIQEAIDKYQAEYNKKLGAEMSIEVGKIVYTRYQALFPTVLDFKL